MRSHGTHDATLLAGLVEAYTPVPTVYAACQPQLTNFDHNQFLHWQHSIQTEFNYLNPFDAVMSAWKLGWSVLCDTTDISTAPSLTSDVAVHKTGALKPIEHDECVRPRNSFRKHHCFVAGFSKKVRLFHDEVSIFIGLEDEFQMHPSTMNTYDLANWTDKPWTRRPAKSDSKGDIARPNILKPAQPSPLQMRRTDEQDDIPRRVAAASTANPNAPRDRPENLPPPTFATDIFNLPEFLALPHDFLMENSFLIRTWYVHHFHHPRWVVPRFVELDHRWVLWQREIADAWRDMIQPTEEAQFFTVLPDPDRSYIPRQVVADVIVAQGLDADRFAGLLTIHQQNANGHLRPYALAISLPDEVSGMGLASAADISYLCNTQTCNFYFRWQNIPFSLIPAHYMHDGHGFSVHITPRARHAASSSEEPSQASARITGTARERQSTIGDDRHEHPYPDQQDEGDDNSEHTADTSVPASPSQFEHWQGVQIYRLNRPVVHCFVRWGTYNSILYDVAKFLREHLRNLIGIHNIQALLAGQHEAEDSVILQYVDDLALGSTEQLIVLDVEVHFQIPPAGLLRAPEVSRRVHRIVPQITRTHVLRIARLANYCFLQGDRCLVFYNNDIWPEQDQSAKYLKHGDYLKVVATPPVDQNVPTETALNFAITIDDAEATATRDCTSVPRNHRALALMQTHAECRVGFDHDHHPLHVHVHRHQIAANDNHEAFYGWLDKLADHFSLNALIECSDEGPIAYVTTWFVDHHRVLRCETHRAVRLVGNECRAWRQLIADAWSDQIDQHLPIRFSIVSPQPPSVETESTLAHVILEQNSVPTTHAAGVISLVRQDHRHAYVSHVAVSIGSVVTTQHVLQKVKMVDLCALRRCTIRQGIATFTPGVLEELNSGFNLVVFIPPRDAVEFPVPDKLWTPGMAAVMDAHSIPVQEGDDDVAFTQLIVEAQSTVCKPSPHGPTENRGIPVILPGQDLRRRIRPVHDGADDWILPIGELFPLHGIHNAWDNENLLPVKTWYVHHLRRTTCIRPRDIQLSDHPIMWIEELRNAWMDLLDPRLPFSIHVVKPKPPQFRTQRQACHILLEQGHQTTRAAIVITALFEGPTHDGISQGAYSVLRHIDLRQVIDTMEIGFSVRTEAAF